MTFAMFFDVGIRKHNIWMTATMTCDNDQLTVYTYTVLHDLPFNAARALYWTLRV